MTEYWDEYGLGPLIKSQDYRKGLGLPDEITESYELLAQGEYNRNYLFTHPVTQKKLLLRVNYGSQMHLDKQIEYEYNALKLLSESGRTPEVYYVDGSKRYLPHGVLVMEYLPGRVLQYERDLKAAAQILGDIHAISVTEDKGGFLLKPENGLEAILKECEEMVKIYMESPLGQEEKKVKIRHMLDLGWERLKKTDLEAPYYCCINTELNSTNFLINDGWTNDSGINDEDVNDGGMNDGGVSDKATEGQNYLIDWEKPLYGDPAQDLGHFLAPTTTFWKTDVILTEAEVKQFLEDYCDWVGGRFDLTGLRERVMTYIPITCLRGITWCAMAWVQYQEPGNGLTNESTRKKLEDYLSDVYLDRILKEYLE